MNTHDEIVKFNCTFICHYHTLKQKSMYKKVSINNLRKNNKS